MIETDDFPLSAAQERLWLVEQITPDTPLHHIAGAVRLTGRLDADALAGALQALVDRHEALRTGFVEIDGVARQRVHTRATLTLARTDLRADPDRLPAEVDADATRLFDLAAPPLVRARLIAVGSEEYVLVLVIHHLVADGWSLGVLLRELGALYAERSAALAELPIQYADFAAWQREREDVAQHIAAWTERLAGVPARLALPGERMAAVVGVRGATCPIELGAELSAALRELSRREKVPVFGALLAGFQAALRRFTGERDVVVGMPTSGRDLPETHEVVGLFVDLVPLRTRIDDRQSFRALLGAVRDAVATAQADQVPFAQLVRALGSSVQVVLAWQAGLPTEVRLGDVRGRGEAIPTGTAKFHVTLALDERDGAIGGAFEYRVDLYDACTIARLRDCFLQLLRAAVARPDAALGELDIVAGEERARVLAWSRGPAAAKRDASIVEAYARWVAEQPDAPALEQHGRVITYRELDARSDHLAARLAAVGVGREALVGILIDRGPAAVTAMLAAWKLGAAYLPLDPKHPSERLRYLIEDAGVAVICADRPLAGHDRPVVIVDEHVAAPQLARRRAPGPDDLAYVLYTSGSSGRPKGVEITHAGLANLIAWHGAQLRVGERIGQVANLGFDASVMEIAGAIAAGATLCFAPEAARTAPAELHDWLGRDRIDVCFAPTPLAEGLIGLDRPDPGHFRLLLTGGDRLKARPRPGCAWTLVDNYGLTEASVVSVAGPIAPGGDGPILIGRPVRGHQVYLLDEQLHPVPAGAMGEVYLGGVGLGRGYRGKPALTAERFVPDPFTPGARLYRTGDLASFSPDGELIVHGRVDDQVKIRGQRIELAEVVAALEEWPAVARAVALVRRSGPRVEPVLAAYLVARVGATISVAELRRHLRARLPAAMVPSLYIVVDDIPLTRNGKVDRDALLRLEPQADAHAPASSPTEQLVRDLWASLLGEHAARDGDASFFDLGGHSLLAAQMIGRLRELVGREVPLRWAFEAATPRALAARLVGAAPAEGPRRIARGGRFPLSSAQQRIWFLDQFTGSGGAYNIAGALRLTGELDTTALAQSLDALISRHEILRTRFDADAGAAYQEIVDDVNIELSTLDIRTDPARLTEELERESRASFDLRRPPLLRARLFRTGDAEHVLSLVVHHIVADGWSIGVVIRELLALYDASCAGRPSPLPALELQYVDYAAWQRERLAEGALTDHLAYWEHRLAGAPSLALPAERTRSEPSYHGGTVRLPLEPELGHALRELGRREGTTLFMTLVAAVQAVLSRATGQDEIVVGTDTAGRSHAALEPLIGLFVNQLVLRGDVAGDPRFRELLGRVRPLVLEAWAHQDVPFDAIVERLRPTRELGRNPLFQVMVILQEELPARLDARGLVAEPLELDPEGSVFDLSLAFRPRDGGMIDVSLRYAAGFGQKRAETLLADLRAALARITAEPEARVSSLEVRPFAAPASRRLDGLRAARPRAASVTELVEIAPVASDQLAPLVVSPRTRDIDLAGWAAGQRARLGDELARAGALLFRGFDVQDVAAFRAVVAAISPDLIQYGERSSPRTAISDGVYTSTDHPSDQPILLHNEQSYTLCWPLRIWFCCLTAPEEGGRTPIADSRAILRRLRPSTVARFAERHVRYVRNYGDGLGLPWTEAFQTRDRSAVEDHCRRASIDWTWKDRDRLRTWQVRPAIRVHPVTHESTWFNHVLFFHASSLPAGVADSVGADDLPTDTCYGDGAPIEPDVLAELRDAYAAETRAFAWQRGDILLLDNMLTAHGREPFAGPRQIAVAMTDTTTPSGVARSYR